MRQDRTEEMNAEIDSAYGKIVNAFALSYRGKELQLKLHQWHMDQLKVLASSMAYKW